MTTISSVNKNYGGKTVKSGNQYVSVSADQVKAQAERRAEQAANKAARQASKKGNVTVYDAAKKQYVSATPEEAKLLNKANKEIQKQRRAEQAAEKAAKQASKKGNVTVFDAGKKLHVSATPEEAKSIIAKNEELGNAITKTVKKSSCLKKAGKLGLLALLVGGLISGGAYLYKKYKNKNSQAETENITPTPAKPPVKPPIKSEENQENQNTNKTDEWIVKKGDNLWNIAKQHLKNLHKDDPNYKPTNKEIAELTEKLIKLNEKEYKQPLPKDSRKRVVVIHENEHIKLTA